MRRLYVLIILAVLLSAVACAPVTVPTAAPPTVAVAQPTSAPTAAPTVAPTAVPPTEAPTVAPTAVPPTVAPTVAPTTAPTTAPTVAPTAAVSPTAAVTSTTSASGFPVTITNCGITQTFNAPPKAAVTMNQAATEVMLALGLQDSMVGTAYLDDEILPEFKEAYDSNPVLAKEYPSKEVLLAAQPDFVYALYSSAFGDDAAGPREDLQKHNIGTYISPMGCPKDVRPEKYTLDILYQEIRDIGAIFGVSDRAEALIAQYEAQLADVQTKIGTVNEPPTIMWWDDEGPSVGACCGAPNEIMRLAQAKNVFEDVPGSWGTVTWEEVVARNPNTIVLVDASWSPAADKQKALESDPAVASVDAVKNQNYVILAFSSTTPGIRNVAAVEDLAKQLYPDKFK